MSENKLTVQTNNMNGFKNNAAVSIGKFPFEYSELQVMDIAKAVGPIKDLKLLFDEMTGKSKGFAVIIYDDAETAALAVRNLNFMTLPNGRFLRCTFVHDDLENQAAILAMEKAEQKGDEENLLPKLPNGIQIHQNQTPALVISLVLSNINNKSSTNILIEAKTMSTETPEVMKALLDQYPQLAHALVELSLRSLHTNRELVEHAVNKRKQPLNELNFNHARLLQEIYAITEEELDELDDDKKEIVKGVKKGIEEGDYGTII